MHVFRRSTAQGRAAERFEERDATTGADRHKPAEHGRNSTDSQGDSRAASLTEQATAQSATTAQACKERALGRVGCAQGEGWLQGRV